MTKLLRENERITFGDGGNYGTWSNSGWSHSVGDGTFAWIDGYSASIEFSMIEATGARTLRVEALPSECGQPHQMWIYLNGRFVGFLAIRELKEASWTVPRDYFRTRGDANLLTFICPTTAIPADLGYGPDQRSLSYALRNLSFGGVGVAGRQP